MDIIHSITCLTPKSPVFPEVLKNIPSPPKHLYWRGSPFESFANRPRLAIVGSRSMSPYGKQVTEKLAGELAERGIVIISGLALGVDAAAHRAALNACGSAIAVLLGPVDRIYPATNAGLGMEILEKGGALVSEYEPGSISFKQNFIARNRIVAGLAQAVLITEAAEKSGSLHTARFALEQGKDVMAVPGNITMLGSVGTNNLIKAGATPVTSYVDVLQALGLEDRSRPVKEVRGRNKQEQIVIDLMLKGISDGEELLKQSGLPLSDFNRILTMLEIGGKIRSLSSNQWSLQ